MLSSLWHSVGGFYEGLSLILKHRYVLKLLGVTCLYEIVVTVLDYEFKILGAQMAALPLAGDVLSPSPSHAESGHRFANMLGHFGQLTNLLSFFISLFGFSFAVNHFGVRQTLLIFPLVLFIAVVATNLVPSLWMLFSLVSLLKALIFALQDPTKELLYIPTSTPIKFKAKAWIEVFGSRLAKGAGSLLCSLAKGDAAKLRSIAEMPCLVISFAVLVLSWVIGTDFLSLVKSNTVVGEDRREAVVVVEGPVRNGLRPGDVGYDG